MQTEQERTEEMAALIDAILQAAAPEAMTSEELESVIRWLDGARIERAVLILFEQGRVAVRWQKDELVVYPRRR